ncbi:MAG: D-alanyl-D-alanine carboxypeptidase/D-alanyl-D-alanine-endopeptidase [Maribacter sp.]
MKNLILYLMFFSLIVGCSGAKRSIQKSAQKVFASKFYDNQFTGFFVINAQNKDTLLNFNGEKYFTPASNTKIFTLFTALQQLPDSIPALKYIQQNDTLFVEGTGDPTFLHSYFRNNTILDFLKKHENIAIYLDNYKEEKLGAGWAWDDYHYYYQPETGAFPIFGNVATINNSGNMNVVPSLFKDSVIANDYQTNRELERNLFYFSETRKDTIEIPFRTSHTLTKNLLEKALEKRITISPNKAKGVKKTLYSVPTDTVLRRMMHESDNFLAEQLLLLSSSTFSDTLSGSTSRKSILENQLADLKHPPRWVDGSGLSRYNLFTPESMVTVLSKMYKDITQKQLFSYFPAGGASGTLEDWYAGNPNPYIYAKSGSLGNVYCLSGYLRTTSGKILIFSFMNNHFQHPPSEVKKQMELIFEEIRDNY